MEIAKDFERNVRVVREEHSPLGGRWFSPGSPVSSTTYDPQNANIHAL